MIAVVSLICGAAVDRFLVGRTLANERAELAECRENLGASQGAVSSIEAEGAARLARASAARDRAQGQADHWLTESRRILARTSNGLEACEAVNAEASAFDAELRKERGE